MSILYLLFAVLEIQDISINVEDPAFEFQVQGDLARIFDEAHFRERVAHAGYSLAYRQGGYMPPGSATTSSNNRTSQARRRHKRYVTVGNATVQVVNVTRGDIRSSEFSRVDIVYFVTEEPLPGEIPYFSSPSRIVYLMHLFSTQEIAIRLGFPVIVKVERKLSVSVLHNLLKC